MLTEREFDLKIMSHKMKKSRYNNNALTHASYSFPEQLFRDRCCTLSLGYVGRTDGKGWWDKESER